MRMIFNITSYYWPAITHNIYTIGHKYANQCHEDMTNINGTYDENQNSLYKS